MERLSTFMDWNTPSYRCQFSPILAYKFNTIPIKTPAWFLVDRDKPIPNFIWKGKVPKIGKTILKRKKNKVGGNQST